MCFNKLTGGFFPFSFRQEEKFKQKRGYKVFWEFMHFTYIRTYFIDFPQGGFSKTILIPLKKKKNKKKNKTI